jgi:hypothetical protein
MRTGDAIMLERAAQKLRDFFNPGEDALNVPALDGPWRPNDIIDRARLITSIDAPDNLLLTENGLYFSSGSQLLRIDNNDQLHNERDCGAEITCLAWLPQSQSIAVGLSGRGVTIIDGKRAGETITNAGGKTILCATSIAVGADETLYIADASALYEPRDWVRDLMSKQRGGRIIRANTNGETSVVQQQLAYPYGLLIQNEKLLISESWRHRLLAIDLSNNSSAQPLLANLAGYPARITATPDGGYWLTVFAMRTKLVEFVLLEDKYREEMMRTIEPHYWIAPLLASANDHLEPLQGGAVKQLGILKPWAPPRSYGLVVRLNEQLQPQYSLHSRTAGNRHGITSAVQRGAMLYLTSKGGNQVLAIDLNALTAEHGQQDQVR